MIKFNLTGAPLSDTSFGRRIYCPAVSGLSGQLADLAIVMPRIDNNRALFLGPGPETGNYAGVLTSDPFGTSSSFLQRLREHGYAGLANWPSAILFEGQTKHWMASIPATPELEYAWLANAQKNGFETLAFFRSLEQGRAALNAGLRHLALHPGMVPQNEMGPKDQLIASLSGLVEKLCRQETSASILMYDHVGLGGTISELDLNAHGTVTYGPSAGLSA